MQDDQGFARTLMDAKSGGAYETGMSVSTTCPKCKGKMEQGFIPVESMQAVWKKGAEPRKGLFPLIRTSQEFPVEAYRCEECGFLEFYAGNEHKTG
jgi:hypothetical protein